MNAGIGACAKAPSRSKPRCSRLQPCAEGRVVPVRGVVHRRTPSSRLVGAVMQALCKVEVFQPVPMAAAHAVGKSMRPWAGGAEAEDVLLQAQRRHLMHVADDGVHCRCVRASSLLTCGCAVRTLHSVAWRSTLRGLHRPSPPAAAHTFFMQRRRMRVQVQVQVQVRVRVRVRVRLLVCGRGRGRAGTRPPGRLPTSPQWPRNPCRRPPQ